MFSLFDSFIAAAFMPIIAATAINRETPSLVRRNTGVMNRFC